jgi:ribosomal protein L40E
VTLSLVKGGARPRIYHDRDTQQIVCRRCEEVTGVATSLFQEVIQSPMTNKGRRVGGTKALICVHCLARGEVNTL